MNYYYRSERETMKKLESFQTKGDVNDTDETYFETDRQSDCKFIEEDDIAKLRENLKWKMQLNQQIIFNNKYVIYELLQSTKHFDLYRAFCQSNRDKVMIRIIDKESVKQSLGSNFKQNKSRIQNEEFLKKLKTQVIVQNKLYNKSSRIFLTQPIQWFENDTCFMKITQNYYDESLQFMIKNRQSFPVSQAIAVLKQVIFTLFQLHREGIILTQLNPKSIIYRNGVFKINDFSSMRKVAQQFRSTLNYYYFYSYDNVLAPQIIVCPEIIDIKTQIWALGVLLYQMIQHDVPYQYRSRSIVKQARSHCIKVNFRQKDYCEEVTNLLKKMMTIDPYERICWRNLLNCEILTNKELFFTPKMIPMIDLRNFSLKKKQSSTMPEQIIINGFDKFPINNQNQQVQNTVSQLNLIEVFSTVDEKQKINIDQYLDLEEDTFKQVKEINLMVLKAKWILEEIVMKLQEEKMVNIKKRSHLEMMCLLADRCHYYMRRSKILHPLAQDPRPDNYLQQLKKLQKEIQELQINYKQHYKSLKSSPFYVLSAIVKTKHKHKDYFLTKEEGLDYSLQQQVDHTQEFFLNKFISETSPKNYQQNILLQKLKGYSKINRITQKNLQGYLNFTEVVNDVLNIKNN